jgi:polysaccharide export outer membrane protein
MDSLSPPEALLAIPLAASSKRGEEGAMAGAASIVGMRDIQTLFESGTASGLSDRHLLERFVSGRDESAEAAFVVLVQRHGPMVLRVCRNVLGDATDAEDAFQATFLVLVKRSGSIRRLESLGSWLFGVACRVAARARVEASKRRQVERQGALRIVQPVDSSETGAIAHAEYGPVVQEEVRRLPEKYRAVVALCYWQGLTQEQAAVQLGCPLGTVRSRLARAKSKLHGRLSRRGLAPLAVAVAAALETCSAEAAGLSHVSQPLINSTVKTSAQIAAGRAITDVASTSVVVLTRNILRSMSMIKFKMVGGAIVVVGLGLYGASLAAPEPDSGRPGVHSRRSDASADKSKSKAQPAIVSLGDYVVEPPDLLIVEVLDALPGRPISGERLVRPDGKISLGFYGDIFVAGLALPEVKTKVIKHLMKFLTDEALGLVSFDDEGNPEMDPVTKKPKMIDPKDSSMVFVDVTAYNSKNYYIQGEVLVSGKLPITGRETILDAINYAGGLSALADHKGVVLYRQAKKGGTLEALPIDIDQITMGDDLSTNYQLLPDDRLVVRRSEISLPEPAQALSDHPPQDVAWRSGPVSYFQRLQTTQATPSKPGPNHESVSPSRRVEARLNELEQKLDLILEVVKGRKP